MGRRQGHKERSRETTIEMEREKGEKEIYRLERDRERDGGRRQPHKERWREIGEGDMHIKRDERENNRDGE